MLEVCQLTKRYGGIAVVDRVSFTIRPGEILGYLGPNGAGKSTTVKMIIGLIQPNAGRVLFHGRDVPGSRLRVMDKVMFCPADKADAERRRSERCGCG